MINHGEFNVKDIKPCIIHVVGFVGKPAIINTEDSKSQVEMAIIIRINCDFFAIWGNTSPVSITAEDDNVDKMPPAMMLD